MQNTPALPPYSLDLSTAPAVIYLFGLAGAGKNFVGDIIGTLSGRYVYHADQDLTEEMLCAVHEGRVFTPGMRDRFFRVVADRIHALRAIHGPLIATQATYKSQHRHYLRERIPDIDFICITASDERIAERLTKRGDHVTADYAEKMRSLFDLPAEGTPILVNEYGEAEVVQQVADLYKARQGSD
jgi:gluconate kinase